MKQDQIIKAYEAAKARYAETGVDTDAALAALAADFAVAALLADRRRDGFREPRRPAYGGIQATGNYPGKPATSTRCAPTSRRPKA